MLVNPSDKRTVSSRLSSSHGARSLTAEENAALALALAYLKNSDPKARLMTETSTLMRAIDTSARTGAAVHLLGYSVLYGVSDAGVCFTLTRHSPRENSSQQDLTFEDAP